MAINFIQEPAGIVVLTIDMPGRSANVLNEDFYTAFREVLFKLETDDSITGAILTSGKKHWIVGADIDSSFNSEDPAYFFEFGQKAKELLRRLEMLGKPVAAALNGTALGGGFELALACHYRVAIDNDRIKFGFPEVGLGLLPGGGGVVRTIRLTGIEKGLEWLARDRKYTPKQALADKMIHALAHDKEEMMIQARTWIAANPAAKAPWDEKGFRIPGGDPNHPKVAQILAVGPAVIRQQTKGNYPAPIAIMSAAVEGAKVDFETACRIESRYFAQLGAGQVSRNMINAFWKQLNQIKKGGSRPAGISLQTTSKVGVLGSGMMGHGIAYVSAFSGMDVVMTDANQAGAAAGKDRIASILSKQLSRGRITQDKMDDVLARIQPTANYDDLAGCDLIIEAVFENRALKANVTTMAESVMDQNGVFASNTSTLPITGLAEASVRPEKFIGLHFFSPVHRMQLVEIIVGEKTDDETLAKAFDYVLAIGKVPIVVNDSRGFYTSRVFGTWTREGMTMLAEGQHPHSIEMAGLKAGMPVGPLAVLDEVSLSLVDHVRQQTLADMKAAGVDVASLVAKDGSTPILEKMLSENRPGRASGAGFYEYNGSEKQLWPELESIFMDGQEQLSQEEMVDRILFIQSLETVRCLDEGVLRSVADANLGSIFGWGFAPFHGGTLQFINAYGVGKFVARAQELAANYGDRLHHRKVSST